LAETRRQRSAFLDEFYKGKDRPVSKSGETEQRTPAEFGHHKKRTPLWLLASLSGITLCIIAVGGSSAMIWLKNLARLFGVHWSGD